MNEWIDWHGEECPVPVETSVRCRLAGEVGWDGQTRPAYEWAWQVDNESRDISKYQVVDVGEMRFRDLHDLGWWVQDPSAPLPHIYAQNREKGTPAEQLQSLGAILLTTPSTLAPEIAWATDSNWRISVHPGGIVRVAQGEDVEFFQLPD